MHLIHAPTGTFCNIAFKTAKAAEAAIAASRKIKVVNSLVDVTAKRLRKPDETRGRTVYVKYLKLNTTEGQVMKHFEACGEIERCRVTAKPNIAFAYVTFTDKESVKEAVKLHNSILNGGTIAVYEHKSEPYIQLGQRDHKLIILLRNKQEFDSLEGARLEKIFSKCGEIDQMEVICGKNVLAFIVFKNEQAVEKALKLSGKTQDGIELEVEKYDGVRKKTSIYVSNLALGML